MSTVPNHCLRQLRAGKLAIGLGVRNARTVDIAQVAKTSGFDWLFIDCEHSSMDLDTAAQISAASLAVGVTPIVRVAGFEHWHASRVADAYKKVIAACRKHGKFPGMGGMYTPELLERHVNMGVQLILSGSDFSLLMQAGAARASLVRGFEKK